MGRSTRSPDLRRLFLVVGIAIAGATGVGPVQAQNLCGGVDYPFPYTDVSAVGAAFCPGIMEAYVTGVSKGTSATTFSPDETVTRVQMTTFLQRSLDQGLGRESRRSALGQSWTPQNTNAMQTIALGGSQRCAADGEAIWASTFGTVVQVQASTGKVLGTWTGATSSRGVVVAAGEVFVVGTDSPGNLYVIDPTQSPGTITTAASTLGNEPVSIAFDGANLWTANFEGSVSIITPRSPYSVTTVSTGFSAPEGIVFDGNSIWVTDASAGTLLKLNPAGAITQVVTVGSTPEYPVFDGANIWVPNSGDNSLTVVQASSGSVVATITADASNQLDQPYAASFDGERVLVANLGNSTATAFKAADLSFIANVSTGSDTFPKDVCSDGLNFWVNLNGTGNLLRF
jgi:DNA-binding beta-propeller fold protein YncE